MTFEPMLPLALGTLAGLAIAALMTAAGFLAERSGLAVLLAAIAVFYPVFAVSDGGWSALLIQGAVFVVFLGWAIFGFWQGTLVLGAGLIAHGLLDAVYVVLGHPGPDWWPAFCAGLDIALGVSVLWLLHRGRIVS